MNNIDVFSGVLERASIYIIEIFHFLRHLMGGKQKERAKGEQVISGFRKLRGGKIV